MKQKMVIKKQQRRRSEFLITENYVKTSGDYIINKKIYTWQPNICRHCKEHSENWKNRE